MQIQQALTEKYDQLSKQPAIEGAVFEASMPVGPVDEATGVVSLD